VCVCAYKRDFIRSPSVEAEKIRRIKYKNGKKKKKIKPVKKKERNG